MTQPNTHLTGQRHVRPSTHPATQRRPESLPVAPLSSTTASGSPWAPSPQAASPFFQASDGPRAECLIVVRESDVRNLVMFDGMREQTYQLMRDDERVEAIRRVGLTPLDVPAFTVVETDAEGRTSSTEVAVQQIRLGGTKAVLFAYRGIWHLWSQASAASTSEAGVNEFTQILIDVICRLRPVQLRAANISRLVRSQRHATILQAAMFDRVDTIIAGGTQFDLSGQNAGTGIVLLTALAMAAAMERDWIVQRTTCGRVAKWRRAEWPFAGASVPEGYRYNKTSRTIEPQPEQRPMIREMLVILGGDAPPSEKQRQLAAIGLKTRYRDRRFGRAVSVDVIDDPNHLIRRLYTHAGIWTQGEFLFRLGNPFPQAQEISGLEVMRSDARDRGELQMLFKVAVPQDGWAEPQVLQRFQAKALAESASMVKDGRAAPRPLSGQVLLDSVNPSLHQGLLNRKFSLSDNEAGRRRALGAYARRLLTPFAGRKWSVGDYSFRLSVHSKNRYVVHRWPKGAVQHGIIIPTLPTSLQSEDLG